MLVAHRLARANGTAVEEDLRRLAAAWLPQGDLHVLDARPAPEQLEEVMAVADARGTALLFLDLPAGQEQGRPVEALAALATALKRAGLPVAVVLMGNPYALPRFREADLLLYLPDDGALALEAALAYLDGDFEATGRLPVMVQGLS